MGTFFLKLGAIKYGFHAPDNAYKGIGQYLGVKAPGNESGVAYGINTPKPPKVAITASAGSGKNKKTVVITRFCDPSNLEKVLSGSLRGKNVTYGGKSYKVASVATTK
ncbi:MAG: hypothetical protein N5P05_000496 [Chroococcopsis gigantea SAG 12.99]|jgi:hypothetical protein|nr:hypothetical protein [Chlorogloea purpurea SAG 13.99]MDV2998890.1 hypothetical protein [Chroococcopsis gigantea SAG 12.99]